MNKCDECNQEREEKDLRYNPKWKNMICRTCFVAELVGNAERNKAQGAVLGINPAAYGMAQKGASVLFDRMLPKRPPAAQG